MFYIFLKNLIPDSSGVCGADLRDGSFILQFVSCHEPQKKSKHV